MRARKLLGGALGFSNSSFVPILLGIFPDLARLPTQASKVFLYRIPLYHLLGETWRNLF